MELKILGNSSAGNCYILDNGAEALVLECGVSLKEVKKAIGYDVARIVAAIVTHEHQDHARYVKEFVDAYIPVYMSAGTASALSSVCPRVKTMRVLETVAAGGFRVQAFDVRHDAAEPFGYLIHHDETGTVLFATDTYYLPYKFKWLNNILIECNYSLDMLEKNIAEGRIPNAMRNRVLQSHMSYETCAETLAANDLSGVNNIVLIHLSENNSNAERFRKGIAEQTGKTVHVAEKNMSIKFNKTPF